MLPVASH